MTITFFTDEDAAEVKRELNAMISRLQLMNTQLTEMDARQRKIDSQYQKMLEWHERAQKRFDKRYKESRQDVKNMTQ